MAAMPFTMPDARDIRSLPHGAAWYRTLPPAAGCGMRVHSHEMLLRPLGNVVHFMPPFCITPEEIDRMVGVAIEGIETALR